MWRKQFMLTCQILVFDPPNGLTRKSVFFPRFSFTNSSYFSRQVTEFILWMSKCPLTCSSTTVPTTTGHSVIHARNVLLLWSLLKMAHCIPGIHGTGNDGDGMKESRAKLICFYSCGNSRVTPNMYVWILYSGHTNLPHKRTRLKMRCRLMAFKLRALSRESFWCSCSLS